MNRDFEIAHTKNLVTARIGALTQGANTGSRDRSMDASKLYKGANANRETLSRMHEARLLIECINASVRYREPIHFRIEPLGNRHRQNRGRVRLCGIVDDPCSASWFSSPFVGTGKTA